MPRISLFRLSPLPSLSLTLLLCVVFAATARAAVLDVTASANLDEAHRAAMLFDGDPGTMWVVGSANGTEGDGVGDWVEIRFSTAVLLAGLDVTAGAPGAPFYHSNRVRGLRLTFDGGKGLETELKDTPEVQRVDCGGVRTMTVRLTVESVYEAFLPQQRGETGMAEVAPVFEYPPEQRVFLEEARGVVREYYRKLTLLDDSFPDLFAHSQQDQEAFAYEYHKALLRQRGLIETFRGAEIDLDGLDIVPAGGDGDTVRMRVGGNYDVTVGGERDRFTENAEFYLLREGGKLRIFEVRNKDDD